MIVRVEDWEKKLIGVVESYAREPWTWGVTDCAHFAGDCVKAITGVDPLGPYRNNYTSRLEAWSRLRFGKHRGATFEQTVECVFAELGFEEGVPACAMAGDVGITNEGVLCVRFPIGFLARGEDGHIKRVKAARAWCVAWPGAE